MNRFMISVAFLASVSAFAERLPPETLGFSLIGDSTGRSTPIEAGVEVFDEYTGEKLTDAKITHELREGSLGSVQVVHVSRPGFTSVSVAGVTTPKVHVFLKPLAALGTAAVAKGKLTGYSPFIRGAVEGGLVLRSLGISDLLALNVDTLLSPLRDEIRVVGTAKIPSNLVFPSQKVGMLLTLDKPTYRLPVSAARRLRLVAADASMELADLIAQLGSTKPADLVNLLRMRKLGWTEKFGPTADVERDIALQLEVAPAFRVGFETPPFASDVFALSVLDLEGDLQTLIPSDVKAAKAGTYESNPARMIGLSSVTALPSGAKQKVIVAAVDSGEKRVSASVQTVEGVSAKTPVFLDAPVLRGGLRTLEIQAPRSGVSVLGWTSEEAGIAVEAHHVVVLPSAGKLEIPAEEWSELRRISAYQLSQIEFGSGFSESDLDGAAILKNLTRVTFSRASATE